MLSMLATLVFAGAALASVLAIAFTARGQWAAIRRTLADSRAIARDREYLVQVTGPVEQTSPLIFARLRRAPQRAVRRLREPVVPAANRRAVA